MQNQIIATSSDQYQKLLDNYSQIVDRTNNSLGLSINAVTMEVTILTGFVAIIAIIVAWYIWKNSKEQKQFFKKAVSEYRRTLEEQAKLFLEQKKSDIDKSIVEFEKIKNSVTSEKKAEFEKVINELKSEKENIISKIQLPSFLNTQNDSGFILGESALGENYIGFGPYKGFKKTFSSLNLAQCGSCGLIPSYGSEYCNYCGNKL